MPDSDLNDLAVFCILPQNSGLFMKCNQISCVTHTLALGSHVLKPESPTYFRVCLDNQSYSMKMTQKENPISLKTQIAKS